MFDCLDENVKNTAINIVSTLWTLASSSYDIVTDSVSAYNYLTGVNIANNVSELSATQNNSGNPLLPEGNSDVEKEYQGVHTRWGSFMIVILFLPGLFWACKPRLKGVKNAPLKRLMGLFFPFFTIGYGIYVLINICLKRPIKQKEKIKKRLALICACEGLFECFPQIIFLSYTFTFTSTHISLASKLQVIGSVVLLAKGIIDFDMVSGDVKITTTKGWILYLLKLLPLYVIGTFFRIASFTLTLMYLRQYAIIPMILLLVMLGICAGKCIAWDRQVVYHMALTNMSVANVGSLRMNHLQIDDVEEEDLWRQCPIEIGKKCQKFIKYSCYLTFIHHSVVLMVVLYLVISGNVIADVTELKDFFRPDRYVWGDQSGIQMVYVTFLGTIFIGVLDVLTTTYCSKNMRFGRSIIAPVLVHYWSDNYGTGFLQDDMKDKKASLENGICQNTENQKIEKATEENETCTDVNVQTEEQESETMS